MRCQNPSRKPPRVEEKHGIKARSKNHLLLSIIEIHFIGFSSGHVEN